MDFVDKNKNNELKELLNSDFAFKLVVLWGEQGFGKTHMIHSVLEANNIKTKNIIFFAENIFPLNFRKDFALCTMDEDSVLMECSKLFKEGICLLFQNMECCDLDSRRLLYRLLKYHKNTSQEACVILEYNTTIEPNDVLCSLVTSKICIEAPDGNCFYAYLRSCFQSNKKNALLFDRIINLSRRNIHEFFSVLNVLLHLGVIGVNQEGLYYYKETTYKIPSSLIDLYIDLFDILKDHTQETLISAAPFSNQIYSTIIQGIYRNYNRFDEYLNDLSKYSSFVSSNNLIGNNDSKIFQAPYVFSTEIARSAVIAKINCDKFSEIISKYYSHLDSLYNNKKIYNGLSEEDKVLLLVNLSKKRQNTYSINQIPYIVELMAYYYKHFQYLNVLAEAERLLNSKILNIKQLNMESHQFWVIYFKSLLAIGKYETVIGYKGQFENEDLNFFIASALYNFGSPEEALIILKNNIKLTSDYIGYVYSLMASIYDWLGDNSESDKYFKKALKHISSNKLKYQLYKKYSIYVDFRIPECQQKISEAIEYYKDTNMKQYAECLHNYGTGCVMIQSFNTAQEKLELSANVLNKICANEIYYPLNSLGILYAYHGGRYMEAIQIWKRALKCDIDIDFCKLAIHNNIFNLSININDMVSAISEKNILETMFAKECDDLKHISRERPDIQHQLRQFYYNCALLNKKENKPEEALIMFMEAKECSKYESIVLYSINQNIKTIKEKIKRKTLLSNLKVQKIPEPTELEKFIHERDMYLCEIMFWG